VQRSAYARSEQMGVYHRHIVGVRLSSVPRASVVALHAAFERLFDRADRKEVAFGLFNSAAAASAKTDNRPVEYGNCAYWSSVGLCAAGLLAQPSGYPKEVALMLATRASSPVRFVSYVRVAHAHRSPVYRDWDVDRNGPVAPFRLASSAVLWQLQALSDAVVAVAPNSVRLHVVPVPAALRFKSDSRFFVQLLLALDFLFASALVGVALASVLKWVHIDSAVAVALVALVPLALKKTYGL